MPSAERPSPELRAAAYYFTLYMSAGAGVVYGGIWLEGKGMSPAEIGVITAVPVLVMLVLNWLVGRLADRAGDWRQVIVLGSLAAGVFPVGLFFVDDFWGILLFWTLNGLPLAAIAPVADAATIRLTRRRGTDFGFIRAWGTIGYMVVILATGYVTARLGEVAYLWLFLSFSLLRAGTSLALPRFRARADTPPGPAVAAQASHILQVMKPWFLLPLLGWAMVFGTLMVLANFQGLLWKRQGIDEGTIGVLIAIGALSEAGMMFAYKYLARRFKARHLILLSALVMALRMAAMSLSPPVPVLVVLQSLHALSFAMGTLASMSFIANWTGEAIAAEAQSFFVVLQQAMSVVALAGFGWLVGLMGAQAYGFAGLFALIGAGLIWSSLRLRPGTDVTLPGTRLPPPGEEKGPGVTRGRASEAS